MADGDKVKYSDIIQPDDSIEKLIKQLGELNQSYETMVNAIRAGADRIVHALKTASGATNEGRKSIDEATASTSRLERAQNELKIAMSDTGKQIAWLKAQTVDQNKATVEQQRYLQQALSSYDKLKSDLKQTVSLYKSLTEAEREDSAMGQQLLQDILNLKNQIKALDDQMKPHIQTLTEVQKAEQKLAYLQSEEGQKLLDLKAKIAEVTAARRQQKTATDPLVQAHEKLAFANSKENQQLKLYSTLISESNRIAKLNAQISRSAEGSYNRLAAQYELNKIKLNSMSAAEREAADSGKKLEAETAAIYQQMIKLQEATGNYRLSVGHYQKAVYGLGLSVSQVVRELPAIAVSLNTFLLGISNNIPMVVDEINRLRAQNRLLQAEGKETVSVTKSIVKALFSWNTVLVVLLTVLSMFGEQIIEWIGGLFKAKNAAISTAEALDNINKELESTNASYGDNIVSLKQLQQEWKNLKTTAEKNQWIKDNKSEFDALGVAVNNATDAENIFVKNTTAVITALKLRAKAAAAQKLAAEQYEKALIKQNEADKKGVGKVGKEGQFIISGAAQANLARENRYAQSAGPSFNPQFGGSSGSTGGGYSTTVAVSQAKALTEEAYAAEKTADAYFDLAAGYEAAAKASLDNAGIKSPHNKNKGGSGGKGAQSQPQDLTETILQNAIKVRREYNKSILKLTEDEYEHRKQEVWYQIEDENNKLRNMLRLNEKYVANVGGKYKKLTDEQKKEIELQNEYLTKTIDNNAEYLSRTLEKIANEQGINTEKIFRTTQRTVNGSSISVNTGAIESSLQREKNLAIANVELEYQLRINTLQALSEEEKKYARSEEELIAEKNNIILGIEAEYDAKIYSARVDALNLRLAAVRENSKEELDLTVKRLEAQRDLELAENLKKPVEEQQNSVDITKKYEKQIADVKYKYAEKVFLRNQELTESSFNLQKRTATEETIFKKRQEIKYWKWRLENDKTMSEQERQILLNQIANNEQDISDLSSKWNNFLGGTADHGLFGGLLSMLGFDEEALSAFDNAKNEILNNLQEIFDAEVELAEAQVELYEKKVDAAQSAYDAEIEARNNGYANNVATTKSELQLEKQRLAQKQKMLEKAKKQQDAFNTAQQASSLITATAQIWQAFSSFGILGVALAIATIGTMFASFAASKIKARQVATAESQEYGEGGLEFLEGGSHASGNDIDLGVNNKKKKRMRAEGGEALAIINKKQTRKYKKALPDIVNSLNRGIFEDKYANAFKPTSDMASNIIFNESGTDITALEKEVREIRKSLNTRVYSSGGVTIIQKGNVKRIIKN